MIAGNGTVGADRTQASAGQTLWLDRIESETTTAVTIAAEAAMRVLVAAGEPLREPVVAGPFVMNTEEQIAEAYADFKAGRFNP